MFRLNFGNHGHVRQPGRRGISSCNRFHRDQTRLELRTGLCGAGHGHQRPGVVLHRRRTQDRVVYPTHNVSERRTHRTSSKFSVKKSCAQRITRVHFDLPARAQFWRSRPIFLRSLRRGGRPHLSHHHNPTPPIILTIAGFDPSAGAGVAADLKTFSAHHCYGVAAITALTVQSTQGVKSIHVTPAAELRAQLDTLLEDVKISAIKIGMLGHRGNAVVVAEFLDRADVANVVLDPVMKSTSGVTDLIDAGGVNYLAEELLKRVTVVTPNIEEAEVLSGLTIRDHASMEAAAIKIVERGARAVIVKGGHMEKAIDVLFDGADVLSLGGDHVKTENTHGLGCTFGLAIAAQLGCGRPLGG